MKRVILLAGPVGSGRAAALRRLADSGFSVIDAEALAQQTLASGQPGYTQIIQLFGQRVLGESGEIDRLKLNHLARANPEASATVRSIIDSNTRAELRQRVGSSAAPFVFIKIHHPAAYGARQTADAVWLFSATPVQRVRNLVSEQGWERGLAESLVRSRPEGPLSEYAADLVLRSGGSPVGLWDQITEELRGYGWTEAPPTPQHKVEAPPPATATLDAAPMGRSDTRPASRIDWPATPAQAPANVRDTSMPARDLGVQQDVRPSLGSKEIKLIAKRLGASLLILLAIAYLTSWGLILAEYGRQHLPIAPVRAALQALGQTVEYVLHHPATYVWAKSEVPWLKLVGATLGHSAGLLVLALLAAILVGFPLGMAAARSRKGPGSSLIVLLSVAGASTPSFLVGMILWAGNIWVHRTFDIKVLPATGFGWDAHVIMPVLVLAMRPIAQVAQITYISVRDALGQDYVRTAHSKGLTWRAVQNVHLLPNVLIPILNTLGTSLR
ncbi:MAG TPA: dephospho-CoA kinase, partial [Anaerolineales bacterium]|nr:dephospho-CoA kinase [Anaerolineales bacterium]